MVAAGGSEGDEGGGGVLGILYRLECQAKVSSASALEERGHKPKSRQIRLSKSMNLCLKS